MIVSTVTQGHGNYLVGGDLRLLCKDGKGWQQSRDKEGAGVHC